MLNLDMSVSEISFAVADTETTGYYPNSCGLVEVAAVPIDPPLTLNPKKSFSCLINPEMPIPHSATAIHGITDAMVAGAPSLKEIMPEFRKFIEGRVLVFHNAGFDQSFLARAWKQCGITAPKLPVVDTVALSRRVHRNLPNHKLDTLISYYGLEPIRGAEERHRALYDADMTAIIFLHMLGKLEGTVRLNQIISQ